MYQLGAKFVLRHSCLLVLHFAILVLAAGCGRLDMYHIRPQLTGVSPASADFLKSEIIVNEVGVADGTSPLLVIVRLANSDNSVVVGYRPTYTVISGSNVETEECSTSDRNGVSTCVLKSTRQGTKKIQFTNIKIDLAKEVYFKLPQKNGKITGLVAVSSQQLTGGSGYTVKGSVGDFKMGIKQQTTGGWQVFGSVQGQLISD